MSKICPICHTENIDSALFCKNCGNSLENKEEQPGWFVHINDKDVGPLSFEEIKTRISTGKLSGDLYVWKEGFDDWTKIRQTELAPYLPVAAKVDITPKKVEKQNLSDALGFSRPTPFLFFVIIEIISALAQIFSLLIISMSSGSLDSLWPKVFLVSSFAFFISLYVGNCFCIYTFKGKDKAGGQSLLLGFQIAFNLYPLLITAWFYFSNMEIINQIASLLFRF